MGTNPSPTPGCSAPPEATKTVAFSSLYFDAHAGQKANRCGTPRDARISSFTKWRNKILELNASGAIFGTGTEPRTRARRQHDQRAHSSRSLRCSDREAIKKSYKDDRSFLLIFRWQKRHARELATTPRQLLTFGRSRSHCPPLLSSRRTPFNFFAAAKSTIKESASAKKRTPVARAR